MNATATATPDAPASEPRLRDRVALITGAGSGIGAATARRFAAEGAKVALFDLHREPAEELAAELGGIGIGGDAADTGDAGRAVAATVERLGGLDTLVTCAGAAVGNGALADLSPEEWELGVRANLQTCMTTTRAALPALIERRGSIVVVSSVGALSSGPQSIAYQTAKAALVGFVHSVAVDYGPQGVRINAVCPGRTLTPMVAQMTAEFAAQKGVSAAEMEERANAVIPLRRSARPEELASVCLFLAGDDSSFMTGSVVAADGGTTTTNVGVIPFLSVDRQ